jgi:hypothetical protein
MSDEACRPASDRSEQARDSTSRGAGGSRIALPARLGQTHPRFAIARRDENEATTSDPPAPGPSVLGESWLPRSRTAFIVPSDQSAPERARLSEARCSLRRESESACHDHAGDRSGRDTEALRASRQPRHCLCTLPGSDDDAGRTRDCCLRVNSALSPGLGRLLLWTITRSPDHLRGVPEANESERLDMPAQDDRCRHSTRERAPWAGARAARDPSRL